MGREGLRDFPASQLFADVIDGEALVQKHKKPLPKTIIIAGMTLNNIDPDAPVDEKTGPELEENLHKLGLMPTAEKQSETPPPPTTEKNPRRGKIAPQWHSDPLPMMDIAHDPHKRRRALGSDASHDTTLMSKKRRKNMGLPEKVLHFKDRLMAINALTQEDFTIIEEKLGYKPESIHHYAPLTQELILHKLQRYKDWVKNQTAKV